MRGGLITADDLSFAFAAFQNSSPAFVPIALNGVTSAPSPTATLTPCSRSCLTPAVSDAL